MVGSIAHYDVNRRLDCCVSKRACLKLRNVSIIAFEYYIKVFESRIMLFNYFPKGQGRKPNFKAEEWAQVRIPIPLEENMDVEFNVNVTIRSM